MWKKRDFELQRELMVKTQIIARGIKDPLVIQAMKRVPRHMFVDESLIYEAYGDYPLPIGENQTISQPFMVASMTEQLELTGGEKVLEIGTGSGYQTAVLAEIVREVYTVERIESLAKRAKETLDRLGYKNVHIFSGDGTLGLLEYSPYDAIIVTAASPDVPPPLFEQLKDGGRMVIPISDYFGQTLVRVRKKKRREIRERLYGCVFVPLVGEYGYR
ncbi:MAG: protein-L-isoaspartate O-methyltransferase [bacterium (Candidatus Stahlbacteria) CG08_land_8_20_14_0_20_40_26]|nr:MAG: protein-L-isoaspartate O-methyltransferase [bacterium (Candidatus Stahlbacteria) CG23_combo_of_CG06-09_8_20_14_all_40_9]PIS25684.1 MAG: protein-L-isoaspartate O-methyltransferase [bacterium (Candidatus Stahlbacteria) CG08_land_8_20_14_0_20_40_26]